MAESFEEGANISGVACRNAVARGLLTVWRHKLAAAVGGNGPGFVPVRIASEGSLATAGEPDWAFPRALDAGRLVPAATHGL